MITGTFARGNLIEAIETDKSDRSGDDRYLLILSQIASP
jgi:hypothetical protein